MIILLKHRKNLVFMLINLLFNMNNGWIASIWEQTHSNHADLGWNLTLFDFYGRWFFDSKGLPRRSYRSTLLESDWKSLHGLNCELNWKYRTAWEPSKLFSSTKWYVIVTESLSILALFRLFHGRLRTLFMKMQLSFKQYRCIKTDMWFRWVLTNKNVSVWNGVL